MVRHCLAGAVVALALRTLYATPIYLDRTEPGHQPAATTTLYSGDFTITQPRDTAQHGSTFTLLQLTTGDYWTASGADGSHPHAPPYRDLSLDAVMRWRAEQNLPADTFDVLMEITPPPSCTTATVIVRRLSVRWAGALYRLGEDVVVSSEASVSGEARFAVHLGEGAPGAVIDSASADSFRISAEVSAPPATVVRFFMSGIGKGFLEGTATSRSQPSAISPDSLPVLPAFVGRVSGGAGTMMTPPSFGMPGDEIIGGDTGRPPPIDFADPPISPPDDGGITPPDDDQPGVEPETPGGTIGPMPPDVEPPPDVPEPSTLVLLALAGAACCRRRPRRSGRCA